MAERPANLSLTDLLAALGGPPLSLAAPEGPPVWIDRAVVDSRRATPGSLFVALRGEQVDGHDFIQDALANGAVAVIAERVPAGDECQVLDLTAAAVAPPRVQASGPVCLLVPNSLAALQQAAAYWRRLHPVTVVGITGSIGKTTSKEMVAAVLARRFATLKSEGNYNNEIGLPLTLLHLTGAHERVVLEMGMYDVGEIRHLASIARPSVGVVTNVGPSHLERLGTIERIAQAKAELPQALPPAAQGGLAVLNADDERVLVMAGQTEARVMTYGLSLDADLRADQIESRGLEGIRFRVHHQGQALYLKLPLLGRHSVHTALSAAAVGLAGGLSWEEIVSGLMDQSAQLRLIAAPGPRGSTILDDTYNASPASSIAALNLLAELSGRKVAVLGDMYELGSYAQEGHRLVGRRAREIVDLLVVVGPLGRLIGQEARDAGLPADAVAIARTNEEATTLLRALIQAGDVVLVKGSRGMNMEQIVADLTHAPAAGFESSRGQA